MRRSLLTAVAEAADRGKLVEGLLIALPWAIVPGTIGVVRGIVSPGGDLPLVPQSLVIMVLFGPIGAIASGLYLVALDLLPARRSSLVTSVYCGVAVLPASLFLADLIGLLQPATPLELAIGAAVGLLLSAWNYRRLNRALAA